MPVRTPSSAAEALSMLDAGLDYLNATDAALLGSAAQGECLRTLGRANAKFTAAHAAFVRAFDAAGGPETDGYPTPRAWLTARTRITMGAANEAVKWARTLARHPKLGAALAAEEISPSWAAKIAAWNDRLPEADIDGADEILLLAAAGGADLADLAALAQEIYERTVGPDDDDDSFGDRALWLDATFGGAGKVNGNLAPGCTAALQALLDALGKPRGPEDLRSQAQRNHDALEEGLRLLIRSGFLPDRAGQDTQVQAHVPVSALRSMPGASELEAAWLAARAGEPGYLAGQDAETIACDATIIPVVVGHPDWQVIDQVIEVCLAAGPHLTDLSAKAHEALRMQVGRLAIDFVSGPAGVAGFLRTRLLDAPYNSRSVPLDIGHAETIPAAIRRAVILRDRHCAWPGCDKPPAACDVHHIVHKKDGGKTSVSACVLLCQFHHDICVHRHGWQIILHPDGTTEARGPHGQILRSHAPPTTRAG